MTRREEILRRLEDAFMPTFLEVSDVSEKHRGHVGNTQAGESHFDVTIQAAALFSLSRVQAHRAVFAALSEIIPNIHALSLRVLPTTE